jgi:hypothetical protein
VYIFKLDVKVLVNRLQNSTDLDVILELDRYFVVNQGLEETVWRSIVSVCTTSKLKARTHT